MDHKELYNEEYYNGYGTAQGDVTYKENPELLAFFDNIANWIVKEINPKTVLDVGCAMGLLVSALRRRGVEAYGIDISEYAISQVSDAGRGYCSAQSALDPLPESFPEKFDLLTTIEMIEHLEEPDGLALIEKMCRYSDDIIFSSTFDGYDDYSHFNVQQPEYWTRHFLKRGFMHDLSSDMRFLSAAAIRFKKSENNSIDSIVKEYEDYIQKVLNDEIANKNAAKLQASITQLTDELNASRLECYKKQEALDRAENAASRIKCNIDELLRANEYHQNTCEQIMKSPWWRLTRPGRIVVTKLKELPKKIAPLGRVVGLIKYVKEIGIKELFERMAYRKKLSALIAPNSLHISLFIPNKIAIEQIESIFARNIKFSILVPIFNTPETFLREMIDSCINQTYANWELCLADASTDASKGTKEICEEYVNKDQRIVYKKLSENGGISKNTNEAIKMAHGDYIALLDHDDILHPAALYENMLAIVDNNADFIYTDETTFGVNVKNLLTIHIKPDFAIDNLRANNYLCHFTTFSRDLLSQVGEFDPECDGSQDLDMFLRLTEKAQNIVHVPKVLYFWRCHENSVTSGIEAKPYCITAAVLALEKHLARVGLKGTPRPSPKASLVYKIDYELNEKPLVSIVIASKDHAFGLSRCIQSILTYSTYTNYEIIIVENNSKGSQVFKYYQSLEEHNNIKTVTWEGNFNLSQINNYGASFAAGKYLLFLHNDIEVISENWIEEMLMFAQREEVGAVGAMLYYQDDTIQHAGIVLGLNNGTVGYSHLGSSRDTAGYMGRLAYTQNFSAVSGSCLLISRTKFEEVSGFNPEFSESFNDVDFCLRLREKNYLNVFTPFAELYHSELLTNAYKLLDTKPEQFDKESALFKKRWHSSIAHDPYYSQNFSVEDAFAVNVKPYE